MKAAQKEQYRDDVRKRILEAAKELFTGKGFEATSMRNIAERINFSPTALYLYYKDKNEIIYALHQEGFKMLSSNFMVLLKVEDPFERLKAMGRVYIDFSLGNSDFYELMFVMKEPIAYLEKHHVNEDWEEGTEAYYALFNTVKACQDTGDFKGMETHGLSLFIWSAMHGLCTLKNHGQLEHLVTRKNILPGTEDVLGYVFENFVRLIERMR